MSEESDAPATLPKARVVVVLIHGTWARDAEWCEPTSSFSRGLLNVLGRSAISVRFPWSGTNSHEARLEAADDLKKFLRQSSASNPGSPHILIAHSHGGNVALYAMRDETLAGVVVGMVFMGTPFVVVEPRQLPANALNVFRLVGVAIALASYIAIIRLVLRISDRHLSDWWPLIGALCGVWLARKSGLTAGDWINARLPSWIKQTQRRIQTRLSLPQIEAMATLNLGVNRDEARLHLRVLTILSNIPAFLFRYLSVTASYRAAVLGLVMLAVAVFLDGPLGWFVARCVVVLILSWIVLPLLQLLTPVLPRLIRSHGLGFGGESLIDNWLMRISIAEEPPGLWTRMESYKLASAALGRLTARGVVLNHSSIYQSPVVIESIGQWIDRGLKKREVPLEYP